MNNLIKKPASTPQIYEEYWEVDVGKKKYILNKKQIEILKQASVSGKRGLIWFDKYAISIPHIQSISYLRRELKNKPKNKYEKIEMSEEERKKAKKELDKIRKNLSKILSVKKE